MPLSRKSFISSKQIVTKCKQITDPGVLVTWPDTCFYSAFFFSLLLWILKMSYLN